MGFRLSGLGLGVSLGFRCQRSKIGGVGFNASGFRGEGLGFREAMSPEPGTPNLWLLGFGGCRGVRV